MAVCRVCGAGLRPVHRVTFWATLVVYACSGCGREYPYADVAQRTPASKLPAYRLRRPPSRALWQLQREGELLVVSDAEDGGAMLVVPLAF